MPKGNTPEKIVAQVIQESPEIQAAIRAKVAQTINELDLSDIVNSYMERELDYAFENTDFQKVIEETIGVALRKWLESKLK